MDNVQPLLDWLICVVLFVPRYLLNMTAQEMQNWLTFLAVIVALFGRNLIEALRRPKLELAFDITDVSYHHKMHFHVLTEHYEDFSTEYMSAGKNCLLKIINPQRRKLLFQSQAAKAVEAKVTFIFKDGEKHTYHPTSLNWSGNNSNAEGPNTVSIMAGAHHFLDFIRFYNYDNDLWIYDEDNPRVPKRAKRNPSSYPILCDQDRIYFEPWFPPRYGGIDKTFFDDGIYHIHLAISGENCGPYKYTAILKWTKADWDKPEIEIKKGWVN